VRFFFPRGDAAAVVSWELPGPIRQLITREVHGARYFSDFPAINDFPPRGPAARR